MSWNLHQHLGLNTLRYIALYLCNLEFIESDPLGSVREPSSSLKCNYSETEYPEASDYIAAIYYGIDKNHASQTILLKHFDKCIQSKDQQEVLKYVESVHIEWLLTEFIASGYTATVNTINNLAFLYSLTKSDSIQKSIKAHVQMVFNSEFLRSDGFKISKEADHSLFWLIDKNSCESLVRFRIIEGSKDIDESINFYLMEINRLQEILSDCNRHLNVFDLLEPLHVKPKTLVDLVRSTKQEFYRYSLQVNHDELREMIDKELDEELVNHREYQILIDSHNYNLDTITEKVRVYYTQGSVTLANALGIIKLHKLDRAKDSLKTLPLQTINTLITGSKALEDKSLYYELLAMTLATGIQINSHPNIRSVLDVENTACSSVIEIKAIVLDYTRLNELMINLITTGWALLRAVILKFVENLENVELDRSVCLQYYAKIKNALGITDLSLLGFIRKTQDVSQEPIQVSNISALLIDKMLFTDCVSFDDPFAKELVTTYYNYYTGFSIDDWRRILGDITQDDTQIFNEIISTPQFPLIPGNLRLATKEVLDEMASSGVVHTSCSLIEKILIKVSDDSRRDWFKQVRDTLVKDRTISIDTFIFFAKWLEEYSQLDDQDKSDDIVRNILQVIVDKPEGFIRITSEKIYEKIINQSSDAKKTFIDLYNQYVSQYDPDNKTRSFAKAIGADKTEIAPDSVS